ncbi:MAG: sigma-54-dependent Fis family transcriptional regulator [Candidatus Coatesbacteria bacterium]|nr:sigma-54-dependent Fis family transcriptional regulator [Candidatus Coatesbacteria bacterium]
MEQKILVVEDDKSQREIIGTILEMSRYKVDLAENGLQAWDKIQNQNYKLVLTDINMPELDGMSLLKRIRENYPSLAVVVITAYGSISSAVDAMKEGAIDYLEKPFTKDKLILSIQKGLRTTELQEENAYLHKQLEERFTFGKLVGKSKSMQEIYTLIEKVLNKDVSILITGESGTGKEVVAKTIHYEGNRKKKPFIAANCAAIPENLLESEFFGFEKGSFTGANQTSIGFFEAANGGTLFLDEIGSLRKDLQAKLLRALQEREIMHIGGKKPIKFDVRIISASSENLVDSIKKGEFREDLYWRLNVIPIHLPPLRERKDDIPLLAGYFIDNFAERNNSKKPRLSPKLMKLICDYDWRGNVRQLENTIERMLVLSDKEILDEEDFPIKSSSFEQQLAVNNSKSTQADFKNLPEEGINMAEMEKSMIINAMKQSNGKIKEAANLLGYTYKTMQYRLKKYNLLQLKDKK